MCNLITPISSVWARLGCMVLVMDQLGHGERRQHPFRTAADYSHKFAPGRQDYYFRYNTSIQLHVVGESLIGWMVAQALGTESWGSFIASLLAGAAVGAAFAAATELVLIRPLYERHIEQVLVTVGLALAAVALFEGIWGSDPVTVAGPPWLKQTTGILGARIPNIYWLLMICAVIVLANGRIAGSAAFASLAPFFSRKACRTISACCSRP